MLPVPLEPSRGSAAASLITSNPTPPDFGTSRALGNACAGPAAGLYPARKRCTTC